MHGEHSLLPNIDLNLLKLFASLYQSGSVSKTAQDLNLSQSACSHALTRLRLRLDDDLFIRIDNEMVPTLFAQKIAQSVLPALQLLSDGLNPSESFNANHSTTFTIATTDYTAWCLKPLVRHFCVQYPQINLRFVSLEQRIPQEALKNGTLDFACGFSHQQERSESVVDHLWFEDQYITAISKQHPIAQYPQLTLDHFLTYQHILIAPWNETKGIVDIMLAKLKKTRTIAVTVPHVLIAPYYLTQSPYLLTLPKAYAQQVAQPLDLVLLPPPLRIPNYKIKLYLHKTRQNDPRLLWFIEQFKRFFEL
ncbi:LysR family transcriptional regulator [Pseudoalteromonas byunsanensis]|uniref:LysR family transcriptional regulator n=1 Tax=Pseudoalteromonas byunsanensis TaxID=327939 RepID=A0A1S1N4V6_9GAMM|nr:LysR family transcriptional regulator [Pseudoalteromonas byunsanensis]OHU93651.1 LysR family transcriptional regulator [Pseudoalteromonas byunsanensis]